MQQPTHTVARAPVAALSDVESFLAMAQALKATTLELRARQRRESGLQRALSAQIAAMTKTCETMSAKNARLRELWKAVKAELAQDAATPGGDDNGSAAN